MIYDMSFYYTEGLAIEKKFAPQHVPPEHNPSNGSFSCHTRLDYTQMGGVETEYGPMGSRAGPCLCPPWDHILFSISVKGA